MSIHCLYCNKLKTNNKNYECCSTICRDLLKRKKVMNKLFCDRCGREFFRMNCKLKEKNYCSKKCSGPENHPKGIKCSIEHKKKMSIIAKEKGFGLWMKGKKGNKGTFKKGQFSKDKHPMWKGGITPLNQSIRHSEDYIIWRKCVFERDNYTCQECGLKFIKGKTRKVLLHADHIKMFSLYPELRFTVSNGRTLCKDCHKEITRVQLKKMWKNQFKISKAIANSLKE